MSASKYNSFSLEDRMQIEKINLPNFKISDEKIKSPNNPADLVEVKLIRYYFNEN